MGEVLGCDRSIQWYLNILLHNCRYVSGNIMYHMKLFKNLKLEAVRHDHTLVRILPVGAILQKHLFMHDDDNMNLYQKRLSKGLIDHL